MDRGRRKIIKRCRPSPGLVAVWFKTVINPILENLEIELRFLHQRNWTWRYNAERLEFIRPVSTYVDPYNHPNMDQFVVVQPKIESAMKEHDDEVKSLAKDCSIFQKALEDSNELRETFLSQNVVAVLRDETFGALPKEHRVRLVAQYVVNSTETLPEHYSPSEFWKVCGNLFFRLREQPHFKPCWERTRHSGEKAGRATEGLMTMLKDVRLRFSFRYKVPPAPPRMGESEGGIAAY